MALLIGAWLCLASHLPFLLCYSLGKSLAWRSVRNPGGQGRGRKVRVSLLVYWRVWPWGWECGAQETRSTQPGMGYPGLGEVKSKLLRTVSPDTRPLQLSLGRVCSSRDPDGSPQGRPGSWGLRLSAALSLLCSDSGVGGLCSCRGPQATAS